MGPFVNDVKTILNGHIEKKGVVSKMTHILCVEDDEGDVFLLKSCLQNEDSSTSEFSVHDVPALSEAFEYLKTARPDIIFLDLTLPDSQGLESFTRLYSRVSSIPIVILSGVDDEQLATEAVRQGAQDYLVKGSVNPWLMGRVIRAALERHRILMELNEANAKLEQLAQNDSLTGLLNRRGLDQFLSTEMSVWNRSGETSSVVLIDMDDFKSVNDEHGHAVGDALLKDVAGRLQRLLRAQDRAARVGGDEFLVVLPATKQAEAFRMAEKIRQSIHVSDVPRPEGGVLRVSASLGIASIPPGSTSIEKILEITHEGLSRSKKSGKNTVSSDREEMSFQNKRLSPQEFVNFLKRSLSPDKLFAVKQPIVSLNPRKIIGYEFLIRSRLAPFQRPDSFFRVYRENRILEEADVFCFKTCFESSRTVPSTLRCHINLFPSTLTSPMFRSLIESLVPEKKGSLCVEISDEQIVGDPASLSDAVKIIKRNGCLLCLEDVGFGRSGLESIIALEPDIVKIDQKYIKGVADDPGISRMLQRLIKMAEALKTKVIVEGIENRRDLEALERIGIRLGQGFELGMPA